ncbi:unnamed protein product [Durusdinium trenchii]|uniref:Methyltransferase domain-containing protein n=1 Tax=Durusdinium trenchii TaxID=1381693 RepID=A0ABP0RS64_9DINO
MSAHVNTCHSLFEPEGSPAKLSAQYGVVVQTAAQSLRHVWRTASRHHAPRRYRAYARLLSSMLEIECIAVFSGCFPGGWHQETESSGRACGFFRAEVNAVLELDHETEADSAYKQLGLPSVDVEKLARHPCYTASPQVRSIDIMEHLTLRSMAVALGSNMFQGTDSQVVPLWVPAFGAHPAHSPSCDDSELLWWYNAPALPRLPSLLQKGWAINLGAGDGSCGYDLAREDGRDKDLYKADDPANCLLQEGFAGIMFEGAETKLAKLKEEFERRPDVVLVLGHTDPDEVVAHVAAFRHRLPPVEAELLKVDFDNCDCCFVEALLQSGIRPRHLHVEVSCFIPPPLVFRPTSFDESIGDSMLELGVEYGLRGHMMHCSLSAYAELLEPFGYKLVRLFLHDALFARHEMISDQDATLWREIRDLEAAWFGCFFLPSTAIGLNHGDGVRIDLSVRLSGVE